MTPSPLPRRFGPYELLRLAPSIGSETVYDAFDLAQAQRVTLRTRPVDAGQDAQERLWRRLRALRHPNITQVLEFGREGEIAFVATEPVAGETLAHYLARVGRIPLLQGLALSAQLLCALAFAHARNLVHAGIALDQLLLAPSGRLKLACTGWSVSRDRRADLKAAARVAQTLLAGASAPGVRAAVNAVTARALGADPNGHYRSADELLHALHEAVGTPLWDRAAPAALPAAMADAAAPDAAMPDAAMPDAAGPVAALPDGARPVATAPDAALPVVAQPVRAPHRRRGIQAAWRGHAASRGVRQIGKALVVACTAAVVVIGGVMQVRPPPTAAHEPRLATHDTPAAPAKVAVAAQTPLVAPAAQPPAVPDARPANDAQAASDAEPARDAQPASDTQAASDTQPARDTQPASDPPRARDAVITVERPTRGELLAASSSASVAVVTAPRHEVRPTPRARTAQVRPEARRTVTTAIAPSRRPRVPALGCTQDVAVARQLCQAMQCALPSFHGHPVCVRMQADARARKVLTRLSGTPD